ncbi:MULTISPECIES: phosphopantetheine-binding protein [unclassified Streptomyces]|uniref:phosphopantetheine-binding protein n=1 Tax=unclassified Streptomyces TaxID=2593676 RepID=UPI001369FECC|nr:acyl carrier protein [Streptomyces sp. SID6139]MYR24475.1 acyl carrier protein [Streptomyces sp. SID6137]
MTGSVTTMIIDILTGKFEVPSEEVTPGTVLEDVEVDSLALLELSLILEKRLGISIDEGTLRSTQTVEEAADVIACLDDTAPAAV